MKKLPGSSGGKMRKMRLYFHKDSGSFFQNILQNNIGARRGFFRNRAHLMESNKSGFPAEKRHGEAQ